MAKYKNGQFIKVENLPGKFRVVKGNCDECALWPTKKCGSYFYRCVALIGIKSCIKKVE